MNWTDKSIEVSIDILGRSETVAQACNLITDMLDDDISPSSLRKAFKRNGYESPSNYLQAASEDEISAVEDETVDNDKEVKKSSDEYEPDGDYHFNEINDLYLVYVPHKRKPMQLTGKIVRELAEAYSNMGAGDTVNQICKTFAISRKDFNAVRRAMNWTHDQDPYTDEEHLTANTDDLVNNLVQKKRREFDHKFRKKEWKQIENDALRWRELAFYLGVEPNLRSVKTTLEDIASIEKYCKNLQVKQSFNSIDIESSKKGSSLIIPVSDLHIGRKFEARNMKEKSFNAPELQRRLQRAFGYIKWLKPHLKERVSHIVYSSLGDNFESIFGNMRPGQHLTMDLFGIDQYKEVIEFHVAFINFLKQEFPDTKITAVFQSGNHDRIFADKRWDSEEVLNYIVTDRIAAEFMSTPSTDLEILLGQPITSITLPNNVNMISQHGHLAMIKNHKDVANFINIHGDKKAKRYLVSQGHLHHWEMFSGFDYKFYMNSSFCGSDSYNLDKVLAASPAEFLMIESSDNNDIFYGPMNLETDTF